MIFDSPYFQRVADVRRCPRVEASSKLPLVLSGELSEREYNRLVEAVAPNGGETEHFVRWLALSGNATGENSQPDRSNLTTIDRGATI